MFEIFRKTAPISTDEGKIQSTISRNVEEIFVKDSLIKKLRSGAKLRVKLGFDPTGSKIHIGRAIILRKLREFQDLGHQAVFIVGDFTARIGDPSDKLEKRPLLSGEQITENLKNYKEQVGKIINLAKAEFHYNSRWLSKLNLAEITDLAESFSVRQMAERRNFRERLEKGEEVSLREFLYPLMQGYDSVAVKADIEIGGFDQLFNLKAGRVVERHFGLSEQDILTTKMLVGTDGRKMSTSWGNVINISDSPSEMFGKVMSIKDELITEYLLLCTEMPADKIKTLEEDLKSNKLNPKDAKAMLAQNLTAMYHGPSAAVSAKDTFFKVFTKGGVPDDALRIFIKNKEFLSDLLVKNNLVGSKTEFRRLVSNGAIEEIGKGKILDPECEVSESGRFRIGKHRFLIVEKN
ncbi:MAG: Tyrosine-tRNA ligase [Parcubacteria group bacterium GW2011_GWA2_47_21]|nr:MAG: Tyrosine-tRNA ligase [Parcubacteria group bacterium GW2011_GWA2_47_21]